MLKKTLAIYLSCGLFWGGLGIGLLTDGAPLAFAAPAPVGNIMGIIAGDRSFLLEQNIDELMTSSYQTQRSDTMPKAMGKDAKPTTEVKKHSKTFYWILGGLAVIVGGYLIYKAVTKTETPIPPSPDYTVTFEVFNHQLGLQKTFTKTGKAGTSITISSADWSDVTNVNSKYWVLRQDGFGDYVTDASDSSTTWTTIIPKNGTTYEIYAANSTNNAPYEKLYNAQYPTWGTLNHVGRTAKWKFLQGNQSASKDVYTTAINQIRAAIRPPWGPAFGELTEVTSGEDINVKFNTLPGILGDRALGPPVKITVDTAECSKRNIAPVRICIAELVETLGGFDDIADTGDHSSYLLITDANGLNALGADIISWVYAKDKKAGTL